MNCPNCGGILYFGTNGALCEKCGDFFKLDEIPKRYKIVMIGKLVRDGNTFIEKMRKELEDMGHETIMLDKNDILKDLQPFEMRDFEENKKAASMKPIEYKYAPDFIFHEQRYYRFKNDIETPVIYHHREYTHFPDFRRPDVLTFAYPEREKQFEYLYPYSYRKEIPMKRNLFVGVDLDMFNPNRKKVIKGKIDIGWAVEYWQFQKSNGPYAYNTIEQQKIFSKKYADKGVTKRIRPPVGKGQYKELMELSESVIIDGGYFGWNTRRMYEAMACKTVPLIRVYNENQLKFYEEYGIEHGKNCLLFSQNYLLKMDNIEELDLNTYDLKKIAKNGFKWVQNHTYKNRAKKLLRIYEEYRNKDT